MRTAASVSTGAFQHTYDQPHHALRCPTEQAKHKNGDDGDESQQQRIFRETLPALSL
jgi:hypothetical protein